MRRLRECVLRDLGWLFNSLNLQSTQDLQPVPQVASSVLNFGLPSFAGRMASSIDPLESAEQLRRAVELFEPRLSAVRVKPQPSNEGSEATAHSISPSRPSCGATRCHNSSSCIPRLTR